VNRRNCCVQNVLKLTLMNLRQTPECPDIKGGERKNGEKVEGVGQRDGQERREVEGIGIRVVERIK